MISSFGHSPFKPGPGTQVPAQSKAAGGPEDAELHQDLRLHSALKSCRVFGLETLPIGSVVVPFCGLYLGSYKAIPQRELLRSLWVKAMSYDERYAACSCKRRC